ERQIVGLDRSDLAGVLDGDDALVRRNLLQDRIEEGGLARARAARQQDRIAAEDRKADEVLDAAGVEMLAQLPVGFGQSALPRDLDLSEGAELAVVVEVLLLDHLLADCEGAAGGRGRRDDALETLARGKGCREQRVLLVDALAGIPRHALGEMT